MAVREAKVKSHNLNINSLIICIFNRNRPLITIEFGGKIRKRNTRDLFALASRAAYSF